MAKREVEHYPSFAIHIYTNTILHLNNFFAFLDRKNDYYIVIIILIGSSSSEAVWYWYSYEWQVRGNTSVHWLGELRSDSGLKDLAMKVVKDREANLMLPVTRD